VTVPDAGGAVVHKSPVVGAVGASAAGDVEVAAPSVIIHLGRSLPRVIRAEKQHDGVIPLSAG
jgi:hypothetical protein